MEMGIPYNKVHCPQFRNYTKTCRLNNKAKHVGRDTYNDHIDAYFKKLKKNISKTVLENIASMYGFPFINLIHYLWTSHGMTCILGASISFIDLNWKKRYLVLISRKHSVWHTAATVGANIQAIFEKEYPDVGITSHIWTVVSDTMAAARNVADHFDDMSQADCAMHGGELLLGYSLGVKECSRTNRETEVKEITTAGSSGVAYMAGKKLLII